MKPEKFYRKPKPDADALREHMPPKIEYNLEDGPEVSLCRFFSAHSNGATLGEVLFDVRNLEE